MRSHSVVVVCLVVAGLFALTARNCARNRPAPGPTADGVAHIIGDDRRAELDTIHQKLSWQIEQSELIADELVAGRTTLTAAADRLMEINQTRHEVMVTNLRIYHNRPDADPRELFARYALTKVLTRLENDPAKLLEVAPRLNAEFQAMVSTDEQPLTLEALAPPGANAPAAGSRIAPGPGIRDRAGLPPPPVR